jgi:TrmH family RNA methyltransferase
MSRDLVTSPGNPLVKRVRALALAKHRREQQAFVVEGIQPVSRAITSGWDVDTLLLAPDLLSQPDALQLVEEQEATGVAVARLSAEVFARVAERDRPGGLAAIVRMHPTRLDDLVVAPDSVVVALHRVDKAGNLGTIIRTVDAAGAAGVALIGDCADEYSPAAVKASMGSLFAVPVARVAEPDDLFGWAHEQGVTVIATSGAATTDHWSADYRTPLAILLGSEGRGLPAEVLDRADQQVRIPMTGTAESLNLATAAALTIYESRKRALHTGRRGD